MFSHVHSFSRGDNVFRCVSEAWDLLKRGHTESYDMVLHFLKACCGVGLCAEALKYIPAGYNVGDVLMIQRVYIPREIHSEVMRLSQAEGELVNGAESGGSELLQVEKGKVD